MANGRMYLSIEGEEKLIKVMSHLEFNEKKRPDALRIAFVKGLSGTKGIPEKISRKTRFEIPNGVVARGEDYTLYSHLIIEKVGQILDPKGIDDFMLRFIEEGLNIMENEINSLSDLDNYLLFLIDKHSVDI